MKKALLLCLALAGCGATCNINPQNCKNMCEPRKVDRLDQTGCYCEGGALPPEKKP